MEILTENLFGHGGIPDTVDSRDHHYSDIAGASAPFDWNVGYDIEAELPRKIPVKNQGQSFSCGGQAWSYFMEILEAIDSKTFEERSAKFIYAQTFVKGGGSAGRTNCDLVSKQGDAMESVLSSYSAPGVTSEAWMTQVSDITPNVRENAKLSQSKGYANPFIQIDSLAQAARDQKGVIIGVYGQNNGTWTSAYPQPPKTNDTWGHWLYIGKAKIVNGKKYLGVLNSWGGDVGEWGWQWLGEEYLPYFFQAWTLYYKTPGVSSFSHSFTVNMSYGQTSDEIKLLQDALKLDGVFPSQFPSTGYYGETTRRAVLVYQTKYLVDSAASLNALNGMRVGALTRNQLNSEFSGGNVVGNFFQTVLNLFASVFSQG